MMFVAQMLDLSTFLMAFQRYGIAFEANPIAAHIATQFGVEWVVALKIADAIGVIVAALILRRVGSGWALAVTATAIVVGIIGGVSNINVMAYLR